MKEKWKNEEEGIKGARREVNAKGEWRRILNTNKYV